VEEDDVANMTITADEDVLRRLRVDAARANVSVSRFVGQVLADKFRDDDTYSEAMSDLFSRGPYLRLARNHDGTAPLRDGIYDRPVLR